MFLTKAVLTLFIEIFIKRNFNILNVDNKFWQHMFTNPRGNGDAHYPNNALDVIDNNSKSYLKNKIICSGDVETNPGPQTIITFNARGLKDYLKLKRCLNTFYSVFQNSPNSIIFLQETHLNENDRARLECMWRYDYVMAPSVGASGGCLILYDSALLGRPISTFTSPDGKLVVTTVQNKEAKHTLANFHGPNDHDLCKLNLLIEITNNAIDEFESNLVVGGDFNVVLNVENAYNRTQNAKEKKFVDILKSFLKKITCLILSNNRMGRGGFRGQEVKLHPCWTTFLSTKLLKKTSSHLRSYGGLINLTMGQLKLLSEPKS